MRKPFEEYTDRFVEYFDQRANDYVSERIEKSKNGLMISKFGSIEIKSVCCVNARMNGIGVREYFKAARGQLCILPEDCMPSLCYNAGFFPQDEKLWERYCKLVLDDAKQIDILGSYLTREEELKEYIKDSAKINLDGYYAPFRWQNPWTKKLKGKKVLVVHPFVDSIARQYDKRELLFENPEVLPEFADLQLVKAVQSMAHNKTSFNTWFDALEYMKSEIDSRDYDIALIGCGAYGMNLAAHIKRQGKIAVHLAGWTQMLFGIYGNRWTEDQPEYSRFINKYWIRPSESERPAGVEYVENACYW